MDLDIKTSILFERNYYSTKRIRANQGSSRSAKTYSILQVLIVDALEQRTRSITTIARKELSTLKATAMRDFFEILNENGIYKKKYHNKSDQTYQLGKVLFEFVGLDMPTKKRGAKRRNLFINEANELTLEDWRQLIIRTTGIIFLDYNPSEEFHWIYDHVLTRDDCEFIHSTYKDNPFLEKSVVLEIEMTRLQDDNFWRVYGLGERGQSVVKIYSNWKVLSDEEWNEKIKKINEINYGLDFGYNVPSALIEIQENEDDIFLKELIYDKYLLTKNIIDKLIELEIDHNKYINADNAEPDKIQEISDAGFNIYPADKAVSDGILYCKRKKLYIHKDSENLIKEIKNYSWKTDRNGNVLDEPVKSNDHLMDAMRYGLYRDSVEYSAGRI